MKLKEAKRLGQIYAFLTSLASLFVFDFFIWLVFAHDSYVPFERLVILLQEMIIPCLVFYLILFSTSIIFGGIAGKKVLEQNEDFTSIGVFTSLKIGVCCILYFVVINFFIHPIGLKQLATNLLLPFFVFFILLLIPLILIGIFYSFLIRRISQKIVHVNNKGQF